MIVGYAIMYLLQVYRHVYLKQQVRLLNNETSEHTVNRAKHETKNTLRENTSSRSLQTFISLDVKNNIIAIIRWQMYLNREQYKYFIIMCIH